MTGFPELEVGAVKAGQKKAVESRSRVPTKEKSVESTATEPNEPERPIPPHPQVLLCHFRSQLPHSLSPLLINIALNHAP
jgi:hypothetical protein